MTGVPDFDPVEMKKRAEAALGVLTMSGKELRALLAAYDEQVEGVKELEAENVRITEALEMKFDATEQLRALKFYADPETYHAIGFFPDRPCGEFMEDFDLDHGGDYDRPMPGLRARNALRLVDAAALLATPTHNAGQEGGENG